ncbi:MULTISPECIES: hypothetical protein [Paraburkholderia]|uniref:Uncharacterized protein n=1 Tax=Paraburkholderia madseniana TaxID=2599607 RepID=A0AAP5ETH0_9BURK|nr:MULTISPECIES: hypothetical protein [Paraburkholderia]MCX4152284.1 hypothetical protein [Paraburkholderia madseniana]MDN7155213.1 hypothetical protein [Paraburkholderia sp. WS6]MDQ6414096.1 hypothetical protein [Paraburkholderia madseniana]
MDMLDRLDAQTSAVIEDDLFGIFFGIAARGDGKGDLLFASEKTHDC